MHRQKILASLGYGAFGGFCLLMSFYWTFPADALAQRLAREVLRQSRGTWMLGYGQASTYRLSGIALQQVTLKRNQPGMDPLDVQLDVVKGRVQLLPLLLARLTLDAVVESGDGSLSARLAPVGKDNFEVHLEADGLDFGAPPLLAKLTGMPVGGKLSGSADTTWDDDLRKTTGALDISIEAASIGPGSISGFTLPNVELGKVTLAAELKDGKLRLTQFKQKGGNVSLNLKGSAQVRQPVAASNVDVCLQFRADPQFLSSNPKIRSALQLAEVQLKKDAEGFLHVPLSGAANAPRVGNGLCR